MASSFWKFSLSLYAAAGFAHECLALQDRYEQAKIGRNLATLGYIDCSSLMSRIVKQEASRSARGTP